MKTGAVKQVLVIEEEKTSKKKKKNLSKEEETKNLRFVGKWSEIWGKSHIFG